MPTRDALEHLRAFFHKKRPSEETWRTLADLLNAIDGDTDLDALRDELQEIGQRRYARLRRADADANSFELLRHTLTLPPSAIAWEALIALFATWNTPDLELALQYANDHLQSWPDELRRFDPGYPYVANWWDRPPNHLPLTRTLELSAGVPNLRAWRRIVQLPFFAAIHHLTLAVWDKSETVVALLREVGLPRLRSLRVSSLPPPDLIQLLRDDALPELRQLELYYLSTIAGSTLTDLLQLLARRTTPVESLAFSGCNLRNRELHLLAEWPGLAHIKKLKLDWNAFTHAGLESLLRSPLLASLEELDITGARLGSHGLDPLVDAPCAASLQSLTLNDCSVTSEGAHALLEANLTQLRTLVLTNNPITDTWAQGLAQHAPFVNLQTLMLGNSQLTDQGYAALVSSPTLAALETLAIGRDDYRGKRLGEPVLRALSGPDILPALKALNLGDIGARSSDVVTFLQSPLIARLQRLDLLRTRWSRQARYAIAACTPFWHRDNPSTYDTIGDDPDAWQIFLRNDAIPEQTRRACLDACDIQLLRELARAVTGTASGRLSRADLVQLLLNAGQANHVNP